MNNVQSTFDGHLGFFQFGVITGYATKSILVHISCVHRTLLLHIYLRVELLGHRKHTSPTSVDVKLFSKVGVTICTTSRV